jgi:hypothetical protein
MMKLASLLCCLGMHFWAYTFDFGVHWTWKARRGDCPDARACAHCGRYEHWATANRRRNGSWDVTYDHAPHATLTTKERIRLKELANGLG